MKWEPRKKAWEAAGLGDKIEGMFTEMLAGEGAVTKMLKHHLKLMDA